MEKNHISNIRSSKINATRKLLNKPLDCKKYNYLKRISCEYFYKYINYRENKTELEIYISN